MWLQCCRCCSTPICCRRRFHSYLLPPQVPLLFAAAAGSTPICLQPTTYLCSHDTPAPTLNPTIHTYIHTFNVVLHNTIYNNIQYRPYHMHSTAAISLSCCYLQSCHVPIQSHLITSCLWVSPHQQHMLCVRMPPIGIHRHVHITTAHSNSTYTSPHPQTQTPAPHWLPAETYSPCIHAGIHAHDHRHQYSAVHQQYTGIYTSYYSLWCISSVQCHRRWWGVHHCGCIVGAIFC